MKIKFGPVYLVACILYREVFRPLLVKAISDPNEDWDDFVLKVCDSVFNYQ